MNKRLIGLFFVAVGQFTAFSATTDLGTWERVEALRTARPTVAAAERTTQPYLAALAEWKSSWLRAIEAFSIQHAADPRRSQAVANYAVIGPVVYTRTIEIGNASRVRIDREMTIELNRRLTTLIDSLDQKEAIPEDFRLKIEVGRLEYERVWLADAEQRSDEQRITFCDHLATFVHRNPESPYAAYFEEKFAELFVSGQGEEAIREFWTNRAESSPSALVRSRAASILRQTAALQKPFRPSLTAAALDGTEVNLQMLRGRVVLLDFWSTDCAPCVAELPRLARLYEEYKSRGFEIIGVAVERPNMRSKLKTFLATRQITWPQIFDGAHWKSPIVEEWRVSHLPSTFLLDREGKLIAQGDAGDRLEALVRAQFQDPARP